MRAGFATASLVFGYWPVFQYNGEPMKKIMKAIGDILSPNDPELVEKTLSRLEQQDQWNDVFSTVLLEMLDGSDSLKTEIRCSLRNVESRLLRAEAVTQAESVLKEKATAFGVGLEKLEAALAAEERATSRTNSAEEQLQTATTLALQARLQAEKAEKEATKATKLLEDAENAFRSAIAQTERTEGLANRAKGEYEEAARTAALALAEAQRAGCRSKEAEDMAIRAKFLFNRVSVVAISSAVVCLLAVMWMAYFLIRTNIALTTAAILSGLAVFGAAFLVAEVRREP